MNVLFLLVIPIVAIGCAVVRAKYNWVYGLRIVLTYSLVDPIDAPWDGYVAIEVITTTLVDSDTDELVLVRADRASCADNSSLRLCLDEPLGTRAYLCAHWRDEAVPLLLNVNNIAARLQCPCGTAVQGLIDYSNTGGGLTSQGVRPGGNRSPKRT